MAPPASLSTQSGIHCTDPHVPISAIEENAIASSVTRNSGGESTSLSGPAFVRDRSPADCFHFSDSGTKSRIRSVSTAGAMPASITHRHEETVTLNMRPRTAMSAKPTLDAAPIPAANAGRRTSGQHSITSATPSDHSPPIPSADDKSQPRQMPRLPSRRNRVP